MKNRGSSTKLLRIMLLGGCLSCSLTLAGQGWAPVGAQWYYGEGFAFSGNVDYMLFESVGDTLIQGKACKRIEVKRNQGQCYVRPMVEHLYEQNDTIFLYDTVYQDFQILYNFNAQPGDSWQFRMLGWNATPDTAFVTLDSFDFVNINGQSLKRIYCHASYRYDLSSGYPAVNDTFTVIEKIGHPNFFYHHYEEFYPVCDANYSTGLRCYQDSSLGLYQVDTSISCDYTYIWTGIAQHSNSKTIQIYPNPVQHTLQLSGNFELPLQYQIYNLNAQLQMQGLLKDAQLNLMDLKDGLYILKLQNSADATPHVFKLFKE